MALFHGRLAGHAALVALVLLGTATANAQSGLSGPFDMPQQMRPYDAGSSIIGNSPTAAPADLPLSGNIPTHFDQEFGLRGGLPSDGIWDWEILPTGLMYHSYLAGERESRMGTQWTFDEVNRQWVWDSTLGGRVGLVRYGTETESGPRGWQFDIEGAAFPRLDAGRSLQAVDFRAGGIFTYRENQIEFKFGYFHSCSHLGDLFMLAYPNIQRTQDVRDSIIAGVGYWLSPNVPVRLYAETSWAFNVEGVAQPWDFQFGAEYTPAVKMPSRATGAPFCAIDTHLRQDVNFSGLLTIEAGWQWIGRSGQSFRIGAVYANGLSEQGQFYNQYENMVGGGFWYDF